MVVDLHISVHVLVLGQEPDGLAKAQVAYDVEGKVLRLMRKLDGPEVCRRREILMLDEIDELQDVPVDDGLEADAFLPRVLVFGSEVRNEPLSP